MSISMQELADRLSRFDVLFETENFLIENKRLIIEFLQEQLQKGEDGKGQKLSPYKNDKYAQKKHRMNPTPGYGVPDYNLTGNLYKNMGIVFNADQVYIKSEVPYFDKIEGRDGIGAFEIQSENLVLIRKEFLYPYLKKRLIETLS